MTANTDVHTCSYYCERPECVRRQRDELRGRMESALAAQQPAALEGRRFIGIEREPNYFQIAQNRIQRAFDGEDS